MGGAGCGDGPCPEPPHGWAARCNEQGHCEYATHCGASDAEIWVPPGEFPMGSPADEPTRWEDEEPIHVVTFAEGFFVGKYEITVVDYEACEASGPCTEPSVVHFDADGWGLNRSVYGRAGHPQNGLDWNQATAFCGWIGGRLLSEAEWEYVASGPVHRLYPWGDVPEPNCWNDRASMKGPDPLGMGCGTGGTSEVGSNPRGASWVGALDMAGSLYEWAEDTRHDSYEGAPVDGSVWLGGLAGERVRRGGSFNDTAQGHMFRTANRGFYSPGLMGADMGARCARDAQGGQP